MIVKSCKVKGEYNEKGIGVALDSINFFYNGHFKEYLSVGIIAPQHPYGVGHR